MGFGNPYGDVWNVDICSSWVEKIEKMGIKTIAISDTIGIAQPQSISYLFKKLIPLHPGIDFGAHFHTTPNKWKEKIEAAYNAGCRRFDAAIRGYGGCPMAKDDLTGNMPTENLFSYFEEHNVPHSLDSSEFIKSMVLANEVFPS